MRSTVVPRTVESFISGEFFLLELSPFLEMRDLKFFLTSKSLVSILPRVQLNLLRRAPDASSSGDLVETAIRLVMRRFRTMLQQIAELKSEEAAATIFKQIDELTEIFTHVPCQARAALERWLPAPPGQAPSPNVIANHCLESLRCRLNHIHACDPEKEEEVY
jgi:hypothetical protein